MYISDEVVYNIILACSKMLGQWKWAVKVSYAAWRMFRSGDSYSPAGRIYWVKEYIVNMKKHSPYSYSIKGQNCRDGRSHPSPKEEPGGHHWWWNVNFLPQSGWKLQLPPLLYKFSFCIPSSSLSFTSFPVQVAPAAAHLGASFASSDFYHWSLPPTPHPPLNNFSSGLTRSGSKTGRTL